MTRGDPGPDPLLRRWAEVDALFEEALEVKRSERAAFVEARCAGDPELREILEGLLRESRSLEGFLDHPTGPGPFDPGRDLLLGSLEGLRLGAFELEELVGWGGLGVVYRARRVRGGFDQEVAVKLLLDPRGREVTRRFERERAILASLSHPGIATLLDGGTAPDGRPYLVMELVEGAPITRYADEARLGVEERLGLFLRVCDAAAAAHARLVVHRDLKPSNILVTPGGDPKLLDFGIAGLLAPEPGEAPLEATALTRTGVHALSPAYASPEQVMGGPVAIASDVFQLGTLLYELLAGHRPHAEAGHSPATLIPAICHEDPAPPSAAVRDDGLPGLPAPRLRARLRGDLDTIVLKALRKAPEARYGSVVELTDDLRRHLDGRPVRARTPSRRYRVGKLLRRNRFAAAVGALVLLGTAAGIGGVLAHSSRMEAERDRAAVAAERAEAVTGFLLDLFEDAEASGARDTLTVGRLLALGEARILGRDDPPEVRIELLDALRSAYERLGRTLGAQRVDDEWLAQVRAYYGPDDLRTAEALVEYGRRRVAGRQFEAGTVALEEGLAVLGRAPGDAGPAGGPPGLGSGRDRPKPLRARALHLLATAYRETGRVDEALDAAHELRDLREAGEASAAELAGDLGSLAFVLRGHGRLDEAAELYDEALALRRYAGWGPDPSTLNNYGSLLRAMGRYDESEARFREALALLWPPDGEEPPEALDTVILNLTELLAHLGRHDEQIETAREALALFKATHRPDHWRVGRANITVGRAYRNAGACERAVEYYEATLEIYRADLGRDHFWTATPATELGMCLEELARLDEAEAALLGAWEIISAAPRPSRALAAANLETLVRIYEAQERTGEAARFRAVLEEGAGW